jgi:acid phosphatase class B
MEKDKAIIVDLDGTLALNLSERRYSDWGRVGDDSLNEEIAIIVESFYKKGYKVLFVTGRSDVCKNETILWLERNLASLKSDYKILMRKNRDYRDDTVIKKEIYLNHIEQDYDVKLVLDDRPTVIRMYIDDLGLKVLSVGNPFEEF